jgi:hypothetical protein
MTTKNYPSKMRLFSEDRHEFDILNSDDAISMKYSSSPYWTLPGEETARLEDNGDGLKVHIDGSIYELDYDCAFKMLILLSLNNRESYKVTAEQTLLECS